MPRFLLNVEADELLYRSAFAVEKQCYKLTTKKGNTLDFGNQYTKTQIINKLKERGIEGYELIPYKSVEPLRHALFLVKRQLAHLEKIGDLKLWLSPSDGSNFRYGIARTEGPRGKGYKANRPPRPYHYEAIREYLIKHWEAEEIKGYEADDALGMYQTNNTVAVHIDKDISMIPGKHYHWVKQERYFVEDDLGELPSKERRGVGKAFFFHQMLTGDNVDNIPGIPNIGPVKATKILADCKTELEMLNTIKKVYEEHYKEGFDQVLLEIADLLYIVDNKKRRGRDYISDLIKGGKQ